jgi:DNA modification methylase
VIDLSHLTVQVWPIVDLVPFDKNARTHSAEQVAQVVKSIRAFGWTNPILVGPDRVIVAGHARLEAARVLKMPAVPVIVLPHLTEVQRRALVIADNQIATNAGWDEEILRGELNALEAEEFDMTLLGFTPDDLAALEDGGEAEAGKTDEDAVPEPQGLLVSNPGDVWVLGTHRVLCGDSTKIESVEKVLDGGLADMVFTDPPYNVNYGQTMKDKLRGNNRKIANDNLGEGFEQFLFDSCVAMLSVAKGAVYICMSSSELHTLEKAFRDAGGHWSTFVIWAKSSFSMGRSDYQRQYEPILYGWKEGTTHFWCGARDQGDIWFIKKPHLNDLHPTMKPVELVERAIENSSKTRDTVFDPFGGSGTTLIACEKTGRQARLIELEPRYVDVICRRWQDFTGKTATLDGDGSTFDHVAYGRQLSREDHDRDDALRLIEERAHDLNSQSAIEKPEVAV